MINLAINLKISFMDIILIKDFLSPEQLILLAKKFPEFKIINAFNKKILNPSIWKKVKIIFGEKIDEEEVLKSPNLRWIHSSSIFVYKIKLRELYKNRNLLLSFTTEADLHQISEMTLSVTSLFAKNLHILSNKETSPSEIKLAINSILDIRNLNFLQVGMGAIGSEICRKAKQADMKTFAADKYSSFSPYWKKVFEFNNLNSILSRMDVICISIPNRLQEQHYLTYNELSKIKEDAILLIVGSGGIDISSLEKLIVNKKFRGVFIDSPESGKLHAKSSPIIKLKNVITANEISREPRSSNEISFKSFVYNLKCFNLKNFEVMKGRVL